MNSLFPTPLPSRALERYLDDVAQGLEGLGSGRKRLVLRELASHLLDEAEAREIVDEPGFKALLAEKEAPEELAQSIASGENGDVSHRSETALLAGALMGLATGGYLGLQGGWSWAFAILFGTAHGFAVGTGIFLARPRWRHYAPWLRVLLSLVFGALLATPLGFTGHRSFLYSRLMYGAFTGYLVERHSEPRPAWQVLLEILVFTGVDFIQTRFFHPQWNYHWISEMAFNCTLVLAVLVALNLRRTLAGRWLLGLKQH
ncbi:MAG: DUF4407 domain-containing protein [Firmicutes bacterium]|nr:DUF4407 domain-containing protein [Bacillota bacterium]